MEKCEASIKIESSFFRVRLGFTLLIFSTFFYHEKHFLCLCRKKRKKRSFLWYFFSCSRENKKAEIFFFSFFLFSSLSLFFIIAPPLQFDVFAKQLWRKGRDRLFFQKKLYFQKKKHYPFKNLTEPNPPPLPHFPLHIWDEGMKEQMDRRQLSSEVLLVYMIFEVLV
jgi:hypothetical protein